MSGNKARCLYLDVLKVIAIVLVCCYHFSWAGELPYAVCMPAFDVLKRLVWGIGSICIPLFFMVNGALLLNSDLYIKKHVKKTVTIWGQHVLWRMITIIIIAWLSGEISNMYKTDVINAFFFQSGLGNVDYAHFWFIPVLLCIYVLYPFVKKVIDDWDDGESRMLLRILVIFLFFFCFLCEDFILLKQNIPYLKNIDIYSLQNFNPFGITCGAMLGYFIIGGLVHKYREKFFGVSYIVFIVLFFAGMFGLYLEWRIQSAALGIAWDNVFGGYTKTPALLMSFAIFVLVGKILNNRKAEQDKALRFVCEAISKNTMNVYYIHWILGYTVLSFMDVGVNGIFINLLKALLLVVVCVVIAEIGKKIPFVRKIFY